MEFNKLLLSHPKLKQDYSNAQLFRCLKRSSRKYRLQQERIQSNANHPLAESIDYTKFEGM